MDWLTVIFNIFLVVGTFFFMEGVAWFTHKYIMHGFLWTWHKSHHELRKGHLERNDLFAVVFSVPTIALIVVGSKVPSLRFLLYIGIGATAYGIFYVLFHDILVHRRVKINFKPTGRYLQRMIRAHYVHHAKHTKENCEAFGFLYAPSKYEKADGKEA